MLSIKKLFGLGVALMLPLVAQAESLLPEVPKAKQNYNDETLCVEPVDDMRRHHMNYIMHQRDDTLRKGIRTKQHSLKECIDCHNAPADDGKVANAESKDHFCSSCHVYSAVQIDCFGCHADKPENTQYRHSLSEMPMPDHAKFASKQLNINTLNLLTTPEKKQ